MERAVRVIGRAETVKRAPFTGESFLRGRDQPRFANARLAGDKYDLSLAGPRLFPAIKEVRQLCGATDQRGRQAAPERKSTVRCGFADNAPSGNGGCKALKLMPTNVDRFRISR